VEAPEVVFKTEKKVTSEAEKPEEEEEEVPEVN